MSKFVTNTKHTENLEEWLQKLGIDPIQTSRIIIDLQANDVARIYVFGFADTKMLEIEPPQILKDAIVEHV